MLLFLYVHLEREKENWTKGDKTWKIHINFLKLRYKWEIEKEQEGEWERETQKEIERVREHKNGCTFRKTCMEKLPIYIIKEKRVSLHGRVFVRAVIGIVAWE